MKTERIKEKQHSGKISMDKYGSTTPFKRRGSVPPRKKNNIINTEDLERTTNPIKLYLKDMGSISLLSREEEIAIARQIEASKKNIIKALSRTRFLFSQIFDLEEKIKESPGIIKKIFNNREDDIAVKNIEVKKNDMDENVVNFNVQSGVVNPFDDVIEEAVLTDLIPYNFEITNIELNGEPVKELPDKSLSENGIELNWQFNNIPPKENIEINYDLRRRVSRTIIFILNGQLKIIKTHSKLSMLELEGLYEAKLPFTNSYGGQIEGVIVEDIIPLYYLHFIKEPTHILPAKPQILNMENW